MAFLNVTNRAETTLAANITDIATSLTVASGTLFPAGNFIITIEDERILVTTRTTDVFDPVTRGYDGTTNVAHSSGAAVALRIIAKHITELQTAKLSQFAATTSAELAGVISDEIGAGKLRLDTSITTFTGTDTLTPAQAGTILVSAAGAYTLTLPTAVGNTGLTYHFIKTDANYNLITLDGDGTETLNFENSTGAPVLTYSRLNTYCAEVTVVSDGANWQVII